MVRSLWTGATGMIAQQLNVDNIANNLANVNTAGFKSEQMEFKSLLYQTIQTKSTASDNTEKPIGVEVGLGVRNSAINSLFTQGNLTQTDGNADVAIDGNGFFAIRGEDGTIYYTRNGHFEFGLSGENIMLTNSDDLPVLDTEGQPIVLSASTYDADQLSIGTNGTLYYPDENGEVESLGITIGLWQFNNPSGLERVGDSAFVVTDASGEALNEATTEKLEKSTIIDGYIESSNVQIADEMVNLIVAQRAYEMNSKVITTSDEMLQEANQLKR
jgi:flagellar basal-body rod protein FlgG